MWIKSDVITSPVLWRMKIIIIMIQRNCELQRKVIDVARLLKRTTIL